MVEFDPAASKSDHEATLEAYLLEQDPLFGAILAPFLRFDRLEQISDTDRRSIRAQVKAEVREALDEGRTP
ncbi:hypothetical protein [Aeromicrobium sp. JJY06]|uniref:hypothetical protein n=1 Tax=Aeromicrobium sp. JJY06 TaxID=3373478 RepID=UPI00376F2BE0